MTIYVRAARHATTDPTDHRTHITGSVLHLAVWVPDPPGTALLPGTGRYMPVCSGHGRPVELWRATGTGYPGWDGHAHWPACSDCARTLDRLHAELDEQGTRGIAHSVGRNTLERDTV